LSKTKQTHPTHGELYFFVVMCGHFYNPCFEPTPLWRSTNCTGWSFSSAYT